MNRLIKAQNLLKEKNLDALAITNMRNIRYFSGFTGSAGVLLVFFDKALLFTDFRYIEQAAEEAKGCQIINCGSSLYEQLADALAISRAIGIEMEHLSVARFNLFKDKIDDKSWSDVNLDDLRIIKDADEIRCIEKAVQIADNAFEKLIGQIKNPMTELEVAALLEFNLKNLGAKSTSFSTIVASGKRSSLPHGQPTEKLLERGDFVTIDFGCVYDGYCSDMTRTFVLGKASDEQKRIYNIVLSAQIAAIEGLKPGAICQDVDALARDIIKNAGFGDNFGHGTGHSLGLFIHEQPRLAPGSKTVLQSSMLVTVEPGIYLSNWGGVRIEDIALITKDGARILTKTSKTLLEIEF